MGGEHIKSTYRSVKWWAYIIQFYDSYIPNLNDRQIIPEQYDIGEFATQFNNPAFLRDDLNTWLLYSPSETEQRENAYLQAIFDGKFPKLNLSFKGYGLKRVDHTSTNEGRLIAGGLSAINRYISMCPKPYL